MSSNPKLSELSREKTIFGEYCKYKVASMCHNVLDRFENWIIRLICYVLIKFMFEKLLL